MNVSFPVGKATFERLYPLTFREFLPALGKDGLVDLLDDCAFELIGAFSKIFEDLLKTYYFVGKMPEAVASYAAEGDFSSVRDAQRDILRSCDADFSKHRSPVGAERCRMVFSSLPRHLPKKHKKFIYGAVEKGAGGVTSTTPCSSSQMPGSSSR